jgi:hypothetical protein
MGLNQIKKVSAHQKKQLEESRDNLKNGRKIFASYSTNKRLISTIYKELKKLTIKITNNSNNNWVNELYR